MASNNLFPQYPSQAGVYPSPSHSPNLHIDSRAIQPSTDPRWTSNPMTPYPNSPNMGYLNIRTEKLIPTYHDYPQYTSPESSQHYSVSDNYTHRNLVVPVPAIHSRPPSPPDSDGYCTPALTQHSPPSPCYSPYNTQAAGLAIDHTTLGTMENNHSSTRRQVPVHGYFPEVSASMASGHRPRRKRRLTTPKEASFHCPDCNKYFNRVYNYNTHLLTHNPDRERPHLCMLPNCNKAFVRRTDLTRHITSIHEKKKGHKCSMCSRAFARKDTLRRHEEDGCSKRIDIQSRSSKGSANWANLSNSLQRFVPHTTSDGYLSVEATVRDSVTQSQTHPNMYATSGAYGLPNITNLNVQHHYR